MPYFVRTAATLVCTIVASLSWVASPCLAARLYLIGEFPTDTDSDAYREYEISEAIGLSRDGSTVIGKSANMFAKVHGGFTWTRDGGLRAIAPTTDFNPSYTPHAISGDGSLVVGRTWSTAFDPQAGEWRSQTTYFQMKGANEPIPLPPVPSELSEAIPTAVSFDGSVVFGDAMDSTGQRHAIRWIDGQPAERIEVPRGWHPLVMRDSIPTDITPDGVTMVGSASRFGIGPGFVWREDSEVIWIPDLPGGQESSYPTAISADGRTVVGRAASNIGSEAYRWTYETGIQGLGLLPGGVAHSSATGVSADGAVIVGSAGSAGHVYQAFIWTEQTGMLPLRDVLEDRGINTSEWYFDTAISVSDDGNTILGKGRYQDRQVAWLVDLVTVPEPSTVTLLAGVLAVVFRESRHRFYRHRAGLCTSA